MPNQTDLTPLEWFKVTAVGVFLAIGLYIFVLMAFLLDGKP